MSAPGTTADRGPGESLVPRRSIGAKLNRLVILSVGTALLIGAALSCWGEARSFARAKRDLMLATAHVFASASSGAVAARDRASVTQALRATARVPGLLYVQVRAPDGTQLAEIGSGTRLAGDLVVTDGAVPSPLALIGTHTLSLTVPVIDSGERVGEIELVSDASGLRDQFWTIMGYGLLGSALALAVGLAFSLHLKRSITRPLRVLTEAMLSAGRTPDDAAPIRIESDDETGLLARRFNRMMAEIREGTERLLAREEEIIERLSRAGELRDDQTGQHVLRVAKISRLVATELGLPAPYIDDLCRASPMHDVGKIAIPDAILHKPGRLDPQERREMERHALRGYEILRGSNSDLVRLAAEIALSHHERWDGKGYPNGIGGAAIPLSGRITAVADVCDALLSERPYKQPWPLHQVRALLTEESGHHFDPACIDALMARWSDLERIYEVAAPGAREVPAAA